MNFCPINRDNKRNQNIDNEKRIFRGNFEIWNILEQFVFVDWLSIWYGNWPIMLTQENAFWNIFEPKWLGAQVLGQVYQNGPWLTHLDPNLPKLTVIGRFGPKYTKTVRDWPIWTQIYQNGPWLANFDQNLPKRTLNDQFGPKSTKTDKNLPKRTLFCQFGPKSTKTDRDWPSLAKIFQNGPW